MPHEGRSPRVVLFDPWTLVPYYTASLAQGLKSAGLEPVLASITYDLDPECFRRAGIRNDPGAFDMVSRRRIGPPAVRRFLKLAQGVLNLGAWLLRAASSASPDVFHVQQLRLIQTRLPLELWFLQAVRALGCRIVVTVHNLLPHDTGDRYRAAYSRLYGLADVLICHSEEAAAKLAAEFGADRAKLRVIPHGPLFPPAALEHAGAAGPLTVLCQGFLRPYKGIEFLLAGWREFQDQRPPASKLIIAGSGEPEYVAHLRGLIEANRLKDTVELESRFLGADEVASLYRSAAVAVYPYREITTSGALMTGVANAKAVIATDLPAFRGLLRHGQNALLVPYGDPRELAAALRLLLESTDLRERLGAELSALNDEFSWPEIGRKTLDCYLYACLRPETAERIAD